MTMNEALQPNEPIILNLVNPKEKFWGILLTMTAVGVTFRGINLDSFDDFVRQAAKRSTDEQQVDLVTMFIPLFRVERIFLDEAVGAVQAYSRHFHQMVGMSIRDYLDLMNSGEKKA